MPATTRRQFLQQATLGSVAAMVTSGPEPLAARQTVDVAQWRSRIGLELYTVRDRLTVDYEGTLAKVAEIGYTEVEPTSYNNMPPKEFRAMLDRLKLTMPSTHAPARGSGADLERQLEGFQMMGISTRRSRRSRPRRRRGLAAAGDAPPGCVFRRGFWPSAQRVQGNRGLRPLPAARVGRVGQAAGRAAQRRRQSRVTVRHETVGAQSHGRVREAGGQSANQLRHPRRGNRSRARDDATRSGLDLHRRDRSDRAVQGAPRPLRALARQGRVRTEDGRIRRSGPTRG